MNDGFVKADSRNLPRINTLMIARFFVLNPDFCSAELRNVKTSISGRESYGDDAIGFVQLKRERDICTIKCTVCPEHKVRTKPYEATIVVDEEEELVTSVRCHDCPASEGGCKHGVAFLMWLHRRTEEPSCTSVECYWRKSNLAKVGTSIKILRALNMAKRKPETVVPENELMHEFVLECKRRKINTCQYLNHEPEFKDKINLSLRYLIYKYKADNCDKFLENISHIFDHNTIRNTERETRNQYKSGLWHELRYGRITASKCYEVSRCQTGDGTLVAVILGARTPETPAMIRGRKLENQVKKVVEQKLGITIKNCGLYISKKFPMVAASPDGIHGKTVFEIKCPTTEKAAESYINKEGKITKRYFAQIQLQMYCAMADKSYFCIASSDFENNAQVNIIKVNYDEHYINQLLNNVVSFWKTNIYPSIYNSVTA